MNNNYNLNYNNQYQFPISTNYENNVRTFINICNHNRTQMIEQNINNIMTLLYENGKCPLIIDKNNILKQYSIVWDVKYLYMFLNYINNLETRKIVFYECIKLCPDILNYTSLSPQDLIKIHYDNFMLYYHTLDELSKKKNCEYLSYFVF